MRTISKKRQKRLIRNLLIAMVCIIAVLVGVIGYVYFRNKGNAYDLSYAYRISSSLTGSGASASAADQSGSFADGFAKKLCVSDADVDLGNIQLQSSKERGLLFDLDSGEAKFARGVYDRLYPASITKIMTASANDCAMAIARTIGDGSVDKFVDMMNEEAKSLGMTGTHFMNPHGLPDDNHYTTPYDVYLMLNEAAKYSEITDVMKNSIYKLTVTDQTGASKAFNLDATDKYLSGDHVLPDGVTIMAGKTGTTDAAGNCLALAVQNRYGIPYIAIIMNAPNKQILYADMDTLLTQTNA